jgi:hypothetical protein
MTAKGDSVVRMVVLRSEGENDTKFKYETS